jgi:hypothetical protein
MTLSGWARLLIVAALLAAFVMLLSVGEEGQLDWMSVAGLACGVVIVFALAAFGIYALVRWLTPLTDSEKKAEAARKAKLPDNLKRPIR